LSTAGIALATVLSVTSPGKAFILMMAISAFGAMFTWMMIFITHYFFRRAHMNSGQPPLRFRMVGFPAATLLGAGLMAAILVTTAFTESFRMTLIFGAPFLACLTVVYRLWYRDRESPDPAAAAIDPGGSPPGRPLRSPHLR
jgi:L-asparagine transporter-like permease